MLRGALVPDVGKQASLREARLDPHLPEAGMAGGVDHGRFQRPDEGDGSAPWRERFPVEKRMQLGVEPHVHMRAELHELPPEPTDCPLGLAESRCAAV